MPLRHDKICTNSANALQFHADADLARWQAVDDLQKQILDIKASINNVQLGAEQDISLVSSYATGYAVSNALGGRITFTATILSLSTAQLLINDKISWQAAGLGLGALTITREVVKGDVIKFIGIGLKSIVFNPYIGG